MVKIYFHFLLKVVGLPLLDGFLVPRKKDDTKIKNIITTRKINAVSGVVLLVRSLVTTKYL